MSIEKDFVPYNEALALRGLGFDEPCFGYFIELRNPQEGILNIEKRENNFDGLLAPTFSQAFRFFREKCKGKIWFDISQQVPYMDNYLVFINVYDGVGVGVEFEQEFTTYEQAELECLRKLIELCKSK